MSQSVINVRGLRKDYGSLAAVRGIDLQVGAGEVFAFLGPNGAGKTTTVEILEGYRSRTAGEVEVFGADPTTATSQWRGRIGIVLQSCRMQPELTVRETLELYAGYYSSPRSVAETIELVGLGGQRDQRVGRLSGGQHRRLDVAVALVGNPELLFLDEPTTGFDPSARRGAWSLIAGLRELGKTIFLTTHYLDEAEALADRVAIIRAGEIVAEGTPSELGGRHLATAEVRFRLPPSVSATDLPPGLSGDLQVADGVARLRTDRLVPALHVLTGWAVERGFDLPDLAVKRPKLEDVYLEFTEAGDTADGDAAGDDPPHDDGGGATGDTAGDETEARAHP